MRAYPAFRRLMLVTMIADTAFWMYHVAIGWLALQLTDSPAFIGMLGFAGGIPMLLVALPAGVLIDRVDRRRVLLLGQVGVILVAALFACLVGSGMVGRASMLALVAAYGTIMSFVFPTRTAMVPSLVARQDLANAVGLSSAAHNATRVVGPSLAGALIALLGLAETFAVAAALQTLAFVAMTRLPSLVPEAAAGRTTSLTTLTIGFRVVAQRPYLMALIMLALVPTVLLIPYLNLMPIFARDQLELGSRGLGVLLASTGLGTVVGSLTVARGAGDEVGSRVQTITAATFAACVLGFAVTPIVAMAVLFLFLAGWMSATFFALNQTALQLSVEEEVRGRVLSVHMLTWGLLPFGQLLVGAVASRVGTSLAMASACLLTLIGIAVVVCCCPSLRGHSAEGRGEPLRPEAALQEST
jgi:MFS family permease